MTKNHQLKRSSCKPASCEASRQAMSTAAASNKKLWWQRSLVRRTATFVQADMEAVAAKSPFLQQPPPEQNILAHFDRSEIKTGDQLGSGGFSIVFAITAFELDESMSDRMLPEYQEIRERFAAQAIDPVTGKSRYVIKHLKKDLLRKKADFSLAASDMALEAAYLNRMDHEHILPLRGLPATGLKALEDGRHDGYFLILDRLEETLDNRITRWSQEQEQGHQQEDDENSPVYQKMDYARQLASALHYLHKNRLIFRDLKPHNIGFSNTGQLQLFDFGLCREMPAATCDVTDVFEMSGVGTRRYMAPEIIRVSCYNLKADVYSWAIVVWQLLTLQKPYAEHGMRDHAKHVCYTGERPVLDESNIPVALQSLLAQAWHQSVQDRCSIFEVTRQLEEILQECSSQQANIKQETPQPTTAPQDSSSSSKQQAPPQGDHKKMFQILRRKQTSSTVVDDELSSSSSSLKTGVTTASSLAASDDDEMESRQLLQI